MPETKANIRVFIIHGHDEAKRRELQHLLDYEFKLPYVVMLDQPGMSRTFIEKFEEESEPCNAAMAVITPDDVVTNGGDAYGQPRPNVILEIGWFMGKHGRNRVLLLVQAGTKLPSDFDGIEQIRFDRDISENVLKLRREIAEWQK